MVIVFFISVSSYLYFFTLYLKLLTSHCVHTFLFQVLLSLYDHYFELFVE